MPTTPKEITIDGETRTAAEWCRIKRISPNCVHNRIHRGWDPVAAITTPARKPLAEPAAPAPRPVPRLLHAQRTGKAYSRWQRDGEERSRTWGDWGSEEAKRAYAAFVAEWEAEEQRRTSAPADLEVNPSTEVAAEAVTEGLRSNPLLDRFFGDLQAVESSQPAVSRVAEPPADGRRGARERGRTAKPGSERTNQTTAGAANSKRRHEASPFPCAGGAAHCTDAFRFLASLADLQPAERQRLLSLAVRLIEAC